MNTKQAKRIKKQIYGDLVSRPEGRKYIKIVKTVVTLNYPDSPRAKYQAAKKRWKKGRK